jgi:GT2 family glycosyltransferase
MRRKTLEPITLPELPPLPDNDVIAPSSAAAAVGSVIARQVPVAAVDATRPSTRQQVDLRPAAQWQRTARIAELADDARRGIADLVGGATYPLAAYDRFRRDHPLRPPPRPVRLDSPIAIVVDASHAAPFLLRETLRSLQEQTLPEWHATVVAPAAILDHPVASFADVDARFRFVGEDRFERPDAAWSLWITAGTMVDAVGLAWLVFAGERCAAELVFADHDHGVAEVDEGHLRADPWLYGTLDKAMLTMVPAPAAVLASAGLIARTAMTFDGGEGNQRALITAANGRIPHVPRLLATRLELPLTARGGKDTLKDGQPGYLGPATRPSEVAIRAPGDDRIAVVIPSRDAADLLSRAIGTLRSKARSPDRLDIVVVDNRSTDPGALALMEELERGGAARRYPFDRPFNWGLASNEGARSSDAPVIVFANNDIEMLSEGWDDILLAALADPTVGAVGARLLYPNGTVQHGGIVFGMTPNHAEHEGRGVPATDPGPNRRLVVPRAAVAMTGAFLAVRRDDFEAIGGIDTTMQIAHSDFDFCLRLRERGLVIRYEPGIEAIHFESVTRGMNATKADVAFDESERADLMRRWGTSLIEDIGVSPYWSRGGTPFETLREPSMVEIVRHIDRTGRDRPWMPSRREAQEEAAWRPEAVG